MQSKDDRQTDREILGVALLDHHRDDDGAEGRHVRHGRAGDAAEEHGTEAVDISQTAAETADGEVRQINDLVGNAARAHDFAHQDKERDGEQRKVVHAVHHLADKHGEIRARDQRAAQRGEQHREGHRHTHQHQRDKAADQHDCGEGCRRHWCSSSFFSISLSAATSV